MDTKNDERIEMLQKFLTHLPTMLSYWDKDLINRFSNDAYLTYFNKSQDEIIGRHVKDLVGPELYEKNIKVMQGALEGKTQLFERDLPLPNGEVKHVQVWYIPDVRAGIVIGFYVIANDISDIKKIEKEKDYIYQKLIQSSKMVALGEMASGIAHEINNPLSIISLNANLARDLISAETYDKTKLRRFIANIQETANRIEKIVTGLQFFSQDRPNDPFVEASLLSILEETTVFCLEKFKAKKIVFTHNKIDENLSIECRPIQISQVLLNLFNNSADAVEHSVPKWISVNVKEKEHSVDIAVSDSGPGIPPFLDGKIMQPFITTKPAGKGTGLGLSISKGIVENHGGKISLVKDALHTTFLITLPKIQNHIR